MGVADYDDQDGVSPPRGHPAWDSPPDSVYVDLMAQANHAEADDRKVVSITGEAIAEPAPLKRLDLLACSSLQAPRREWSMEGWRPLAKTVLITGDGGVGKSLAEQQANTCMAAGIPFLGIPVRQMNAAYISWEDDLDELWARQEAICRVLGVPMSSLQGKLHLISMTEEEQPFMLKVDGDGKLIVTDLARRILQDFEHNGIRYGSFDNASQILSIDHNKIEHVAPCAHWLNALAYRLGGGVGLIHHPNKAGDDWLGSVAYTNQFRSRIWIGRPENGFDLDARIMKNPKANYSKSGAEISFHWVDWAFVLDSELGEETRAKLEETARATADNAAFLACLEARNKQERHVSATPSPNYAPTQFMDMPQANNIGKERLKAAMDRLFLIGQIRTGALPWTDSKGRPVTGLIEVAQTFPNAVPNARQTPFQTPPKQSAQTPPNYHYYTTYNGAGPLGAASPAEDDDPANDIFGSGE